MSKLFEVVEEKDIEKKEKKEEIINIEVKRKHVIMLEYEETFEVPITQKPLEDKYTTAIKVLKSCYGNVEYKFKNSSELLSVDSLYKEYS